MLLDVAAFRLRDVLILLFLCFASSATIKRDGSCRRGVSGASPVLQSTTMITATGECLAMGRKSLLYTAITTALTCVLPLTSDANHIEDGPLLPMKAANGTFGNIVGVFSPGYKIDAEQYSYLVHPFTKLITAEAASDADSTISSLRNDANLCFQVGTKNWAVDVNDRMKEKKFSSLLFMGHSRGGAVAALAAAIHLNSTTHSNAISEVIGGRNIPHSAPMKSVLMLLDPVDSSEGFVLEELRKTMRIADSNKIGPTSVTRTSKEPEITNVRSQSSSAEQGTSSGGWPWPVLIVSTPFGGQSKYYKVPYESSCSPVHRNGDAFARALRGYSAASSDGVSHPGDRDRIKGSHVVHVRLPDVGHTQLLQNRKKSTVGSVCVANEKISDEDVKGLISSLAQSWVTVFGADYTELESLSGLDDVAGKVEELRDVIAAIYPEIRTEWSF